MSYLLDTNVISESIKPAPSPRLDDWLSTVEEGDLYLSAISFSEIERGIALMPSNTKRAQLASWATYDLPHRFEGRILSVDIEIARLWGQLTAKARIKGRQLEAMDGALAATALVFDLTLVTRNAKDFAGLHVKLINPWDTPSVH